MSPRADKPNVKTAQKLKNKPLELISRVLVGVGKPFYLALSTLIVSFLFVSYWIGHSIRVLFTSFFKLLKPKPKKKATKKRFQFKFPKVKFEIKIPKRKKKRKISKVIYKAPRFKAISFPKLKKTKIKDFKKSFTFIFSSRKRFLIIFATLLFLFAYWFLIVRDLPAPKELVTRDQEVSTKIYDRNGVLLYNIYKEQNRSIVPLEDIPLHVQLATLAAEDAEFYSHPGFSVRGMIRAFVRNITRGEFSGGSTITQQLVKNALLSSEKTVVRKIRELLLAIGVERTFTKDEILEMYLNEVSYGGTAYGIQEASRVYFDKDVDEINLAEAALLAGLPKSPTTFSPFGPSPEEGIARQRDVLRLMRINKYINEDQETLALNQNLTFAANKTDILAPHFVMYVRQILENTYGPEVVEQGGLEVFTTLDYEVQKVAENAVASEVNRLARLNVGNGAALVLDPKTGEILAMVGSKDYFDTEADGNVNVTTALRQPGSSIKLVNYAYALSNGYTTATTVIDSPISFSVPGQPTYSPRNYDGDYRGIITLRSAFAESRNTPAVKVLASYGVNNMIEMGRSLGITSWEEEGRFGLSLTLGGGEVRLTELATAYATVANYGKKPNLAAITKVTNYKGTVLEENTCSQSRFKDLLGSEIDVQASEATLPPCGDEQILDEGVAFLLTDILSDNSARAPAFGSRSLLVIPNHPEVAVKTGTSNDLKDNLAVGYNQDYLVATWVGNNDGSPMARVASGITGATPIFNSIMTSILAEKESIAWIPPDNVTNISICTLTGTLPCEGCPTRTDWFLTGTVPTTHCSSEAITKIQEERDRRDGEITPEAASTIQ